MKYLKKFEHIADYGEYWSVNTEKYYMTKALKKINCPDRVIKAFIDYVDNNSPLYKKLYVIKELKNQFYIYWDASYDKQYKTFDYNGDIELTPKELEEVEMEKNADKYNL